MKVGSNFTIIRGKKNKFPRKTGLHKLLYYCIGLSTQMSYQQITEASNKNVINVILTWKQSFSHELYCSGTKKIQYRLAMFNFTRRYTTSIRQTLFNKGCTQYSAAQYSDHWNSFPESPLFRHPNIPTFAMFVFIPELGLGYGLGFGYARASIWVRV